MSVFTDPLSPNYARLTGGFYLLIAVSGGFSIAYVPSQLFVAGDPAASIAATLSRMPLFHLGLSAELALMVFEVMASTMLFLMFRMVNPTLALAALLARLLMVAVMTSMLFFYAGFLNLADPAGALSSFSAAQRADLAGLMLDMHHAGVWIWQVFFTLHLLLLGWLVHLSGRFPRVIGLGLMIGAAGYLVDSITGFAGTAPGGWTLLRNTLLVIVSLSEIGFAFWLLIAGQKPSARALPQPA